MKHTTIRSWIRKNSVSSEFLEGKGEAGGYPATRLPVVAMGLVPHIYRRACFSQRATPGSLPQRSVAVQRFQYTKPASLSDGEFDPSSVFAITQANQSNVLPAKIDCVGLMEEVETLKEIARLNKGTYYQAH